MTATASYVESASDGYTDRYGFAAHGLSAGTPHGVIIEKLARKPGAGTANIEMVSELSGTIMPSPAATLSGGWQIIQSHFPEKPGGGAWSLADIDSGTYGIRIDVP